MIIREVQKEFTLKTATPDQQIDGGGWIVVSNVEDTNVKLRIESQITPSVVILAWLRILIFPQ